MFVCSVFRFHLSVFTFIIHLWFIKLSSRKLTKLRKSTLTAHPLTAHRSPFTAHRSTFNIHRSTFNVICLRSSS